MFASRLHHALKLALRSLVAHLLRSGLTTLGIVLGVGSVIVMLAVGEAARYQALKQLEDLGANTIVIRSVKPSEDATEKQGVDQTAYGITYNDLERIKTTVPTVVVATPVREYKKVIRNQNIKVEARVVAVTPDFFRQSNIEIAQGRGITDADDRKFDNVCVLGAATADKLFPTNNPVGRAVMMENIGEQKSYLVIGVTEPKILATGADGGEQDFSRVMFIPFSTDRVRIGRDLITSTSTSFRIERLEVSQVTVVVDDVANVSRTAAVLQSLMDQFHPNKDVVVIVPLDLLRKAEQTQQMFTLIIGAIAGISLVVGGIGIMNIMLATVTERTREIGIRRALGAKQRDIALQFLMETLVLSCGGGLLGIGLGVVLALVVSEGFGVPAMVRWWSPAVAFGVSLLVGLVSGIYPAWRAARLDPIEALRHN